MQEEQSISVRRLRLGLIFFILWWLPFYLLSPLIASLLGSANNSPTTARITLIIVVIQTILGILGVFLAGKELISSLKSVRFRKMPRVVWQMTVTGETGIDGSFLKKSKAGAS